MKRGRRARKRIVRVPPPATHVPHSAPRPMRNSNRHRRRVVGATHGSRCRSSGHGRHARPKRTSSGARRREAAPVPRFSSAANSDRIGAPKASWYRARASGREKRRYARPRARRAYRRRANRVVARAPSSHSQRATRSRGERGRAFAPPYRCRVTMPPASTLRRRDRPASSGRRAARHLEIEQDLADRHPTDGFGRPAELFGEHEARFGERRLYELL